MRWSAVWFAALALGCGAGDELLLTPQVQERRELLHPGAPHQAHVTEPTLALAPDGTPWLAWIREDGGVRHVEAVRLAAAAGEPERVRVDPESRPVASTHQPPGLAVGTDGRAHVSWSSPRSDPGGSPFASDLVLASSQPDAAQFGAPLRLHADQPGSRGFEGLAADADGGVLAAWIEGGERAGTRLVRVAANAVSEPAELGTATCPCCRIAVATGAAGRAGVLWRDEQPGSVRDMLVAFARDGGAFAAPQRVHDDGWSLAACPHRGGALAFDAQGRALAAWYTEGRDARPALLFAAGDEVGFSAPRALHEDTGSLPDRIALAVGRDGAALVLWERATSVRREIAARAVLDLGARMGPVVVLSRGVHASGPQLAAAPDGGFVAAWNEEEFPSLRTVVARVALAE